MVILSILLLSLFITIIVFAFKLMAVVRNNDYYKTTFFFKRYLSIIFLGLASVYLIMITSLGVNLFEHEYNFVLLIKFIIHAIYLGAIYITSRDLLNNLSNEIIFDNQNPIYIQKIGSYFIYLAVTEMVAGIVVGIINFLGSSAWKEFRLQTNTSLILFLVIGLILLIISFILKRAVEIYQENQLTI